MMGTVDFRGRSTSFARHLLWFGPLLTFGAAVSYFTTFARFPALRDVPWLNLPLVLAGLAVTIVGVRAALSRGTRRRTKVLGLASGTFSFLLATLFCLYIFVLSYRLPGPTAATLSMTRAPDFTLLDQDSRPVTLSDLAGRKVVLSFYRGFW
jgi:hypothetical protein